MTVISQMSKSLHFASPIQRALALLDLQGEKPREWRGSRLHMPLATCHRGVRGISTRRKSANSYPQRLKGPEALVSEILRRTGRRPRRGRNCRLDRVVSEYCSQPDSRREAQFRAAPVEFRAKAPSPSENASSYHLKRTRANLACRLLTRMAMDPVTCPCARRFIRVTRFTLSYCPGCGADLSAANTTRLAGATHHYHPSASRLVHSSCSMVFSLWHLALASQ